MSNTRPSDLDLAEALRYIRCEFVLRDGDRIDGEMIAEGLALAPENRFADESDIEAAKRFALEFDDNAWWHLRARADRIRGESFGLSPRYKRVGECVCSLELRRAVGCRCCYRSV